MKLFVRRPHRLPLYLVFPNRLLFGRFSAWLAVQALKQQKIKIDPKTLYRVFRQIPYQKWKGLPVIEVHAADGTEVKITV